MASSDVGKPGGAHGKEQPRDAEGFQLRHTGWRLALKHAKCGNVQTKNNLIFIKVASSLQNPPELSEDIYVLSLTPHIISLQLFFSQCGSYSS